MWKFRMRSLLEREELWDIIDQRKPEQVDVGYAAWRMRMDIKARATISLFVQDNQLRSIKKCETTREMW